MISILIPTFNYDIFPLVTKIHSQCIQYGIEFEIITFDDGSGSNYNIQNQKINSLNYCSFEVLPENIGRSAIRNLLARKAKYQCLLFLDADVMPDTDDFMEKYIDAITPEEKVVYGGICYQPARPDHARILRWVYGNKREALTADNRRKSPYLSLLTLNFMISKSVFEKVSFNEHIPNLRHEDTLFSHDLKLAGIKVEHIDNKVIHHGLESSGIFLRKSEESLIGLKFLLENNLLPCSYARIGAIYCLLRKTRLKIVAALFFRLLQKMLRKNISGSSPSLFLFDVYRLGYLCNIS